MKPNHDHALNRSLRMTLSRLAQPVLLLAGSVLAAGCAGPSLGPNLALLDDPDQPVYRDADWAAVLSRFVKDGLVDYDHLSREPEPLDRYYALLSVTGPTKTPEQFRSSAAATAYWINAYNALALCAVMSRYPVTTMYDMTLPRLEQGYRFRVDGRSLTLAQIEEEMLTRSLGDVRTLLATSRAALGTPRLTPEPIRTTSLNRQLAEAAAQALDNPDLLRIDHTNETIFLWQLIFRREGDFLKYWRRTRRTRTGYLFNVLLELASPERRRALQSAVGYTIRQIPFDRRLNRGTSRTRPRVIVP